MHLKSGTETSTRNKDFINKTGPESITAPRPIPPAQHEEQSTRQSLRAQRAQPRQGLPSLLPDIPPSRSTSTTFPSLPCSQELLLLPNQIPGNLQGLTPQVKAKLHSMGRLSEIFKIRLKTSTLKVKYSDIPSELEISC